MHDQRSDGARPTDLHDLRSLDHPGVGGHPVNSAFGQPGLDPTWTSGAKDVVTTALGGTSRVWLTIGGGIGNEVYWPSTGQPQVRDIGFIVVSDGRWFEVKHETSETGYSVATLEPGVLAPTIEHVGPGWSVRFEWLIDPDRDVVMVRCSSTGRVDALYCLVAPHLGSGSTTNSAWVDDGLHAVDDDGSAALAVVAQRGFRAASVGFVGASDGWQDVHAHGEMAWNFDDASNGNVALTAALEPTGDTLAFGLASTSQGATTLARSSLGVGFEAIRRRFVAGWQHHCVDVDASHVDDRWRAMVEHSAAVLACHEDRTFPGATVASLSIPWGDRGDDLGGYHLVWPRDCVEVAFGHLALGNTVAARRTLDWLAAVQQPDGHWAQNTTPDGRAFWTGLQLDEAALPVLLAAALLQGADADVDAESVDRTMVRRAIQFLVDAGPISPQDRWEENAGINAFTLAAVIAALVMAAPWLDDDERRYVESLADCWHERIDDWMYEVDGPLCDGRPIAGYYVRISAAHPELARRGRVDVRNRSDGSVEVSRLVALDFLALVRFGLRRPDDQRIVDSVALVDELLAVELPTGIAYRRYNGDGYGEHDDGSPFDGTGVGRAWPLLAGERGHYAAQLGESVDRYLDSMMAMTGRGQLLPEQVWDGPPIAQRRLEPGEPTGSAMPLAWAHAEFVKLATYIGRGRPIEQFTRVTERYLPTERAAAAPGTKPTWHWRHDLEFGRAASSKVLIDHPEPFTVAVDGSSLASTPGPFGRHLLELGADQFERAITAGALQHLTA